METPSVNCVLTENLHNQAGEWFLLNSFLAVCYTVQIRERDDNWLGIIQQFRVESHRLLILQLDKWTIKTSLKKRWLRMWIDENVSSYGCVCVCMNMSSPSWCWRRPARSCCECVCCFGSTREVCAACRCGRSAGHTSRYRRNHPCDESPGLGDEAGSDVTQKTRSSTCTHPKCTVDCERFALVCFKVSNEFKCSSCLLSRMKKQTANRFAFGSWC